jgi:hypothetical protein
MTGPYYLLQDRRAGEGRPANRKAELLALRRSHRAADIQAALHLSVVPRAGRGVATPTNHGTARGRFREIQQTR